MGNPLDYRLMSGQILRIFISSTSSDLGEARREVTKVVLQLKQYPIVMDYGAANEQGPLQVSLGGVADCDIFLGLIGYRFGTSAPGDPYSITQREYFEAQRLGKLILMYLPLDIESYRPAGSDDSALWEKQKAFLRYVQVQGQMQGQGHTYGTYSSANMLPATVATDLHRVLTGGASGIVALNKGLRELFNGNYPSANYDLSMAAHFLPDDGLPAFLFAIATLRGRSPRAIVALDEKTHIAGLLEMASKLAPGNRAIVALWGAYLCDAYGIGAMNTKGQRLIYDAGQCPPEPELFNLIERLLPELFVEYLRALR